MTGVRSENAVARTRERTDLASHDLRGDVREAVRALCSQFPDLYWRELDGAKAYPDEFVLAMTEAGTWRRSFRRNTAVSG